MSLKDTITAQMMAAMKNREKVRVAAIRLIRDAIQKAEIAAKKDFEDAEVVPVLARLMKQRQESIQAFEAGGRNDLVERETQELGIIKEFMPQAMGPEELRDLVAKAITETQSGSPSDMGKVMKALKGQFEGRAGGKEVSEEVKRQLAVIPVS